MQEHGAKKNWGIQKQEVSTTRKYTRRELSNQKYRKLRLQEGRGQWRNAEIGIQGSFQNAVTIEGGEMQRCENIRRSSK